MVYGVINIKLNNICKFLGSGSDEICAQLLMIAITAYERSKWGSLKAGKYSPYLKTSLIHLLRDEAVSYSYFFSPWPYLRFKLKWFLAKQFRTLVPVNQAAICDCDVETINVFLSFGGLAADQSPQRPPDLGRTIVWGHQDLTCDSFKTLEVKLFWWHL